jgi:hypothetical protein
MVDPQRPLAGQQAASSDEVGLQLLRAAFSEGMNAKEAWRLWRAQVDLLASPPGTYELLPLLYRRLEGQGIAGPDMRRLKGVYRYAWFSNQRLKKDASELVATLERVGVDTVLAGDLALALVAEKTNNCYPIDRVKILVGSDPGPDIRSFLQPRGWSPIEEPPTSGAAGTDPFRYEFVRDPGHRLRMLPWSGATVWQDDRVRVRTAPIRLFDVTTRTFHPVDHFLYSCDPEVPWPGAPLFLRAATALLISKAQDRLDWLDLLATAREEHLGSWLRLVVDYLREALDMPFPTEFLRGIERFSRAPVRPSPPPSGEA